MLPFVCIQNEIEFSEWFYLNQKFAGRTKKNPLIQAQNENENENYFNWNNWLTDHYYSNTIRGIQQNCVALVCFCGSFGFVGVRFVKSHSFQTKRIYLGVLLPQCFFYLTPYTAKNSEIVQKLCVLWYVKPHDLIENVLAWSELICIQCAIEYFGETV